MKKILIVIGLLLFAFTTYGQVNVSISNMQYINGTPIANCGTIDFGTNSTVRVQFTINLSKQSNQVVGTSNLYVYTIGSSGSRAERKNEIVQPVSFDTNYQSSADITLNANDFNASGGTLFAVFKTSSGTEYQTPCSYAITKTLTPSFTLYPTSLSLPCGNTSSRTFTVTPANIPSGATVTYQWSIGNGWSGNVGNGNSITITPTSSTTLPSSVSVTPLINGVAQSSKTCTVSRPTFTTSATINGSSTLCATGIYTMNNLPNGVTVQSVSSSNTNVATVSLNSSNGQITATKVSNGTFTLSVVLQNTCSQPTTKTKTIQAGENANVGVTGLENGINAGSSVSISLSNSTGCSTIYFTSASSGLNFDYVGPDYAVLSSTSSNSGTGWVYISLTGGTSIYKEFPINVIPPPVIPNSNYISVARIENNYNVYPYNQWKMVKAYYYGNSSDVTYWEWNIGTSYYAKPNDSSVIFLFQSSSNVTVNVRACNNNGCSPYVSTVIN
jgi:hypothetical protein